MAGYNYLCNCVLHFISWSCIERHTNAWINLNLNYYQRKPLRSIFEINRSFVALPLLSSDLSQATTGKDTSGQQSPITTRAWSRCCMVANAMYIPSLNKILIAESLTKETLVATKVRTCCKNAESSFFLYKFELQFAFRTCGNQNRVYCLHVANHTLTKVALLRIWNVYPRGACVLTWSSHQSLKSNPAKFQIVFT